jgi:hypothetical protein
MVYEILRQVTVYRNAYAIVRKISRENDVQLHVAKEQFRAQLQYSSFIKWLHSRYNCKDILPLHNPN